MKTNKWEHFTKLKTERVYHKSAIIKDQLYSIGGFDNDGNDLADTEAISISKNVTRLNHTIPLMHNERCQFGMCSFAGCIFVAGGNQNEDETFDKCEFYSFNSYKWTETSSMNTKRASFPLIYFQDKTWAIGGVSNGICLDTIETYDLSENKWTTIDTKLLSKRCSHSAIVHNNKFFVIGGVNENKTRSSVEVYSSVTNQFSFVSSMNISRTDFGCCVVNSRLYVIGGFFDIKNYNVTDGVEIYDIENDVWENGPCLPLTLSGFGCSDIFNLS